MLRSNQQSRQPYTVGITEFGKFVICYNRTPGTKNAGILVYIRLTMSRPYDSHWYTVIRPAVLNRDNHTCQSCGVSAFKEVNGIITRNAVLHVHHTTHNAAVRDMSKLITLCDYCHRTVHKLS